MTLAAFLAAWALHLMAAASPGPAVLMTARTAASEGIRTALLLAVGVGLGAVVWAAAALFGLAILFKTLPTLLWAFKIAGGLFLCWIAVQMWRHADEPLDTAETGRAPRSAASALRLGLVTQLVNPKPAVFFGAVFLGTVPPDAGAWVIPVLLVMVFVNELACNALIARLFSFDRPRRTYARLKSTIDRSFGGILALMGLRIATT